METRSSCAEGEEVPSSSNGLRTVPTHSEAPGPENWSISAQSVVNHTTVCRHKLMYGLVRSTRVLRQAPDRNTSSPNLSTPVRHSGIEIREQPPGLVVLERLELGLGEPLLDQLQPDAVPTVIFVTAFDQFALRAFEAHALDYLLKPYDDERFSAALDRARARIRQQDAADVEQRLRSLLADVHGTRDGIQGLVVRTGARSLLVAVDEIDWFEAEGKYVRLHVGPKTYLVRDSLSRLELELDARRFLRIHRSTIVNVERVREIEAFFRGEYIVYLSTGAKLRSGRAYRHNIQGLLGVSG